jgi:hypothetical protein
VQTRDALIDYFQRHKIVRRIAVAGECDAVAARKEPDVPRSDGFPAVMFMSTAAQAVVP